MYKATDAAALRPGTRLSSYEIDRVLHRYRGAIVYAAHEALTNRDVLIEECLPTAFVIRADGDAALLPAGEPMAAPFSAGLERFRQEARLVTDLDHPNTGAVLAYFEMNGTAYLVTKPEADEAASPVATVERAPLGADDMSQTADGGVIRRAAMAEAAKAAGDTSDGAAVPAQPSTLRHSRLRANLSAAWPLTRNPLTWALTLLPDRNQLSESPELETFRVPNRPRRRNLLVDAPLIALVAAMFAGVTYLGLNRGWFGVSPDAPVADASTSAPAGHVAAMTPSAGDRGTIELRSTAPPLDERQRMHEALALYQSRQIEIFEAERRINADGLKLPHSDDGLALRIGRPTLNGSTAPSTPSDDLAPDVKMERRAADPPRRVDGSEATARPAQAARKAATAKRDRDKAPVPSPPASPAQNQDYWRQPGFIAR